MSACYVIGIFASEPYVRVSTATFATLDEASSAVPELQARFDRRLGVARLPTAAECDEHQSFIAAWRQAGGFESGPGLQTSFITGGTALDFSQAVERARATL